MINDDADDDDDDDDDNDDDDDSEDDFDPPQEPKKKKIAVLRTLRFFGPDDSYGRGDGGNVEGHEKNKGWNADCI